MSRRVLLVFDDYSEMMKTQAELMKVGFDLAGIVNEALLTDQLMNFNPALIIVAGQGGKVSAIHVCQRLKENSRYQGKVLVLLPSTQKPQPQDLVKMRMDAVLEYPAPLSKLLVQIGKLMGVDGEALIDKYSKAHHLDLKADRALIEKKAREERALAGLSVDSQKTTFERRAVKDRLDAMKKDWDFNLLDEIDELKRKFVAALFRK